MPYHRRKHHHSRKSPLFSKFTQLFKEEKHHGSSGGYHFTDVGDISKEAFPGKTLKTNNDEGLIMFLIKLGNSMIMFMVTYVIVWFIYQLSVMYTASLFHIPSILRYYELKFFAGKSSSLWTELNIIEITFTGPLISLVIGFITLIVLKIFPKLGPQLKLFLMWLCINSMAHFFGAFVSGFITGEGFGYVISWMFIPYPISLIISVIFLSLLVYQGLLLIPVLLSISDSRLNKVDGLLFIFSRLTFPWFIGSGLLIYLKIPNVPPQHKNIFSYDIIILLSMGLVAFPPLLIKYINYRRSLRFKGRI
jgi:hypothetical protein